MGTGLRRYDEKKFANELLIRPNLRSEYAPDINQAGN
jgi:hypothetical protein